MNSILLQAKNPKEKGVYTQMILTSEDFKQENN